MRFIPSNAEGVPLTTMKHASLSPDRPPLSISEIRFYRGPLPATSTRPDNVYAFYQTKKFKGQRVLQTNVSGSL